ncbi:MAG: hypothetical protein OSB33_00725 [Candidatus Poseidoniales archaeon]|nr:hypothetical protein [Candidatus Poseidoniales archaeon]
MGVLQALSAAEGRVVSFEEHEANPQVVSNDKNEAQAGSETIEATAENPTPSTSGLEIETVVLEVVAEHAGDEGIDYDSVMKHCAQRGFTDEDLIEDALFALRDDKCEIMEPRFGWYKTL